MALSTSFDDGSQSPPPSGLVAFEFQTNQIQPSPLAIRGWKRRSARSSSVISLPTIVADPLSPLVERSVRRTTRLNKADGFYPVKLSKELTKKHKICVLAIDEKTGKTGPVPLPVLQGWGINCRVTLGELSDEALMQTPVTADVEDASI